MADRPLTIEEWADLDEDEPGEWVDGWLVEEEVPTYVHELVVSWLVQELGAWCRPNGGNVLPSEWKMRVSATRGRKPDVVVYLPGQPRPRGHDSLARTPPGVVVEVVTPRPRDARRDRVEKLDEYAVFGVRWYWIVDPQLRSLEVYELADGRYVRALGATEGAGVSVPGLSDLSLDLDALWAEVDRAEQEPEPS